MLHDRLIIALDYAQPTQQSVRNYDVDGRMHVKPMPISKAQVNEYLGREIPGWKALGLDPTKIYRMLRDPQELAKAASTFNNLPLLKEHVPVTADVHRQDLTIGTTGSTAVYKHPHLFNSLALWMKPGAIDDVEDDRKREVSAAYHYRPDMTPGVYEGERYDGVMRDIKGNHLCLVKDGRADDVVIGDSKETINMANADFTRAVQTATVNHILPLLAKDASLDLSPAFKGVTKANFVRAQPTIVTSVAALMKGKLKGGIAMDDASAGLKALLGALGGEDAPGVMPEKPPSMENPAVAAPGKDAPPPALGAPPDPAAGPDVPPDTEAMGDPAANPPAASSGGAEAIRSFLLTKLDPADMAHLELLISQMDTGEGGAPGEEGAETPPDIPGGEGGPLKPPAAAAPPKPPEAKPAAPAATGGGGAKPPFPPKKPEPKPAQDKEPHMQPPNTAMDQNTVAKMMADAIKANDAKHQRIANARQLLRAVGIGDIQLACDSAEEVLRLGLKSRGIDASLITEGPALELLVKQVTSQSRPTRDREPTVAMDSKDPLSFDAMYPGLRKRVGRA